jgi:hypothetical protein
VIVDTDVTAVALNAMIGAAQLVEHDAQSARLYDYSRNAGDLTIAHGP